MRKEFGVRRGNVDVVVDDGQNLARDRRTLLGRLGGVVGQMDADT